MRIKVAGLIVALLAAPLALAAEAGAPAAEGAAEHAPVAWQNWHAGNDVSDVASLQRGARDFMNYCVGCHSLKYLRYQRMADDLRIPASALGDLIAPGSTALDYITSVMPSTDAATWFGKTPPDLSLITRSKGKDYVYQLFKTFYVDSSRPTLSNNLADPNIAMPAVLSELEGLKRAVFRKGDGGEEVLDHFESVAPGNMTPEQYDNFVRDLVNFLDYAGEPVQVERRSMGIWVVLFMLVLSAFAYLTKREFWKAVH